MKKFIKGLLLLSVISFIGGNAHALYSRSNLQNYERNLDILADKSGSLDDLIGELQGFDVIKATCEGSGSVIVDSDVGASDTVLSAIVLSSGNIVRASSATLVGKDAYNGGASAILTLRSKVSGTMGNNISVNFVQATSSSIYSGALTVNVTGYAIDVILSSAGVFNTNVSTNSDGFANASRVCTAIQNNDASNSLITCETSHSTRQVVALSGISLSGGQGSVYFPNVISGSYFTCGSGTITLDDNTPVSANDDLILYLYKRP